MAPLIDPVLLLRILQDAELTKALAAFFKEQADHEVSMSAQWMGQDHPDPDLARKHACYANAYEEAMNRLRAYVKQV